MNLIMPGIAVQTLTVYRTVLGSRVNGRWVDGGEDSFTIRASSQPANGEERRNLPEGVRSDDIRKLYTEENLLEADETTGQAADEVDIGGKRYRVVKSYSYDYGATFGYNKVMVEKV